MPEGAQKRRVLPMSRKWSSYLLATFLVSIKRSSTRLLAVAGLLAAVLTPATSASAAPADTSITGCSWDILTIDGVEQLDAPTTSLSLTVSPTAWVVAHVSYTGGSSYSYWDRWDAMYDLYIGTRTPELNVWFTPNASGGNFVEGFVTQPVTVSYYAVSKTGTSPYFTYFKDGPALCTITLTPGASAKNYGQSDKTSDPNRDRKNFSDTPKKPR